MKKKDLKKRIQEAKEIGGLITGEDALEVFRAILEEMYPTAIFFIVLRNFNHLESVMHFGVEVDDESRFYVNREDVSSFLPEEVTRDLQEIQKKRGNIGFSCFHSRGRDLAKLLKRKVELTHMMESNDPMQAEFKDYLFKP